VILIEPTLVHCLKIWWAFCWRAGVMMKPGMFVRLGFDDRLSVRRLRVPA
jgi:hypothetical protein